MSVARNVKGYEMDKKLKILFGRLELAKEREEKARQKREEIEQDIALKACPFSINQCVEGEYGKYYESAIIHEIKYREEWPHFWARAKFLTRSGEVFIVGGNVNDWKATQTSEPPF